MIHIISGEDVVASRNRLNELILEDANITRLDGKKNTVEEISKTFSDGNLFDSKICVVIENYTKIKSVDAFAAVIQQFGKNPDIKIVLWDENDPALKLKNAFKNANYLNFTYPKVYFNFLDRLSPVLSKDFLALLHEVLKTYSSEQILYSIIKRIRQLLLIKLDARTSREFQSMQGWQTQKLQKQANLWTEDQLKSAFVSYVALEEMIKTSGLTMDLASHLDILLISDLN